MTRPPDDLTRLTDDEALAAGHAAWERRLPLHDLLTQPSFGVQYLADWSDFPDDWRDRDDWDNNDEPVRFATREDAWDWVRLTVEVDYRRRHNAWETQHAAWVPARDLYNRRRQLLIDHDLWVQPEESMSPLVAPAGPREPQRRDPADTYRVVSDTDMDTPAAEHETVTAPDPGRRNT